MPSPFTNTYTHSNQIEVRCTLYGFCGEVGLQECKGNLVLTLGKKMQNVSSGLPIAEPDPYPSKDLSF